MWHGLAMLLCILELCPSRGLSCLLGATIIATLLLRPTRNVHPRARPSECPFMPTCESARLPTAIVASLTDVRVLLLLPLRFSPSLPHFSSLCPSFSPVVPPLFHLCSTLAPPSVLCMDQATFVEEEGRLGHTPACVAASKAKRRETCGWARQAPPRDEVARNLGRPEKTRLRVLSVNAGCLFHQM